MNQQLATETKIEFHKQRAITYLNMAAKNIILVGHELIAIKKELPHGQFIAWIEANLGVSRIQANNWMRLAENENKLSNDKSIYHLSDTSKQLFLSAPEEVKEQIKLKIDTGETISTREILRLKEEHKQALQKTTKLYEEKLRATSNSVEAKIKEAKIAAENTWSGLLDSAQKRAENAHTEKHKLDLEILNLKAELFAINANEVGDNTKETQKSLIRLENELVVKNRELEAIQKNIDTIPDIVAIYLALPTTTQNQQKRILTIIKEGK